jgi:F-type H+-transporting ATPase subunit a
MRISPDSLIFWQYGFVKLNATILFTWLLMFALVFFSKLITRKLTLGVEISRWQCALEIIVLGIKNQLEEIGLTNPERYIGFIGTLFLFIFFANLLTIIPGFEAPTASLSTTTAMALSVFIAVPAYGIREQGIINYLKSYLKPTFFMLPFHIISEVSRTLSLAVRLFGNMMSGAMTVGLLLSITPFIFPMIMTLLGLLIGTVQAYIFSVLATVYVASAIQSSEN